MLRKDILNKGFHGTYSLALILGILELALEIPKEKHPRHGVTMFSGSVGVHFVTVDPIRALRNQCSLQNDDMWGLYGIGVKFDKRVKRPHHPLRQVDAYQSPTTPIVHGDPNLHAHPFVSDTVTLVYRN